ncbi:type I 3-dehydrogenase-like protein [Trichoderma citrinoviride]|uniref:Type I 3-dehydrogenase-like protein n=1 Tax=Trichoderma citrinoviride TaxID=58853 RepID=A0A2T4BKX5_9HYPO|nr:type I 3-dehydrogenase-like protein [Trichoderma citrinoviride]PTB69968.1 type I 3-dehydrogenase-like protein [Trichoderma citrinoviride]
MAAVQQLLASPSPTPAPAPSQHINNGSATASMEEPGTTDNDPVVIDSGLMKGAPQPGDSRIAVIVYGQGQEHVVSIFAEVLGKPVKLKRQFRDVDHDDEGFVVGLALEEAERDVEDRDQQLLVAINAHCISPHSQLMAKPRTFFISTTFPDVRAALPNLDILTVGADAVEIRVDLLREPRGDGTFSDIPSLSYVGQQVMLLRQRTELPIIFTTRCTQENGKFPMDNPDLYYEYLYRAVQWGVEYIDVELWLPERIRKKLYEKRGNSRIMSAFHDFSGTFKWPSQYAQEVFERSKQYADIVKMIAIINDHNENFELEYFRSKIRAQYPDGPPLSAVNMGEIGQFSRTLNTVFSPITHPLLPIIAAPGQMSTAEINAALALLGQLPKKYFYGISSAAARSIAPRAPFYEKCFNELGLPHQFAVVERQHNNPAGIQAWCNQRDFGGAYLDPGLSYQTIMKHNPWFSTLRNGQGPTLSEAAQGIGIIDTIVVKPLSSSGSGGSTSTPPSHYASGTLPPGGQPGLAPNTSLIFDNASWRGILSTLTRDLAPSAYFGRTAVVLALTADDAAPVFFALKALKIAKIYTVGFRTPSGLARNAPPIEQFISMESLQRARSVADNRAPFVIISALGRGKSNIVGMLLRVFGEAGPPGSSNSKKVFLNLAEAASQQKNDPVVVAEQSGFTAYDAADVAAFTTVESLRLLVGQNVPYSFVRLASGNLF